MLSKPLIITALLFQIAGVVWGLVLAFQSKTLDLFFSAEKWPIYVGFVLLLVAILQSKSMKKLRAEREFVDAAKDALEEDEADQQDKNEQKELEPQNLDKSDSSDENNSITK
jgi:hypothetical protein